MDYQINCDNSSALPNLSNNNSKRFNSDQFKSSTPISTKVNTRPKNDSAYSSFVSQKAYVNVTSNSSSIKESITNYESPGTSFSSRNSALNDDELEECFKVSELENDRYSGQFFISDSCLRRSARNSPWTVRPGSAPLNEEEEDSDKEASNYFCNYKDAFPMSPELSEVTISFRSRIRHASMTDGEQRNELIANKLRQIADNLPNMIQKKAIHKSFTFNNESCYNTTKRHSCSSFSDMMPNGMGSALDLIVSLFNIYKQHSERSHSQCFGNSHSMHNILKSHRRLNIRNRSYTE